MHLSAEEHQSRFDIFQVVVRKFLCPSIFRVCQYNRYKLGHLVLGLVAGFSDACLWRFSRRAAATAKQVAASEEGERIVAIVRLTLEKQTEEYLRRFEAAVREHPEIEECFLMTGDADYILRVSAASASAYEAIHTDILSRLPGVARIHSSMAMRNVLQQRPVRRARG